MKRFNIRQVEAFRAIITLGSMTKAAELLGISQPAVSRLMLDFQEAVGFKLFVRQRNGTEPTDDARQLFTQVEKLFVGLEELNQQVHAIKQLTAGRISIAAMGLYSNGLLPQIIAQFNALHPDITISLDSQPHQRIVDWVASGRSDIGFATLPVANSGLTTECLASRPALCVFARGHAFADKDVILAKDLMGQPFISFPRGTPFRFQIDSLFDSHGVERSMTIEATTHEAVCNLVAAGLGVAIVSPYSPHLHKREDLIFKPFKPDVAIDLGIVYDAERLSTPAQAFVDMVTRTIGDNPMLLPAVDAKP